MQEEVCERLSGLAVACGRLIGAVEMKTFL